MQKETLWLKLLDHLANKLPVSRLQETDRLYCLRNLGVPMCIRCFLYCIEKGFDKLYLNKEAIDKDLEDNWAVQKPSRPYSEGRITRNLTKRSNI